MHRLILWDIDRTLLFVGENDRLVYSEILVGLVGSSPTTASQEGKGRMETDVVRAMLIDNGIPDERVEDLLAEAMARLPAAMWASVPRMRTIGTVVPCALEALKAVNQLPDTISTVVTGNLRETAEAKLTAFELNVHLDTSVAAFSSDAPIRADLVRLARARASERYNVSFTETNTLIIGDAIVDIVAGRDGGAAVVSVATGRATAEELWAAGARVVLPDLCDRGRLVATIEDATS